MQSNTATNGTDSNARNKGRGITRGLGLNKLNKASGSKLAVHIPLDKGRPVDRVQSAKLSSQLGIIARQHIVVPTKWKNLTDDDKLPAFEHLDMKLNINLTEETKERIEFLLQGRSRDQRYKLHKRFLSFPSVEEARRNPPPNISQENWDELCTYWSDPKVKARCATNKNNRDKCQILHNQGSASFVVVRHELSKKECNEGEEMDRVTFHKRTHYSEQKGWTTQLCEAKYNEMKAIEEKAIEEDNPMTRDQIFDQVMGEKSGYIKGLGYGPKPATKSFVAMNEKNRKLEEALQDSRTECAQLKDEVKRMETILARHEKMLERILGPEYSSSTSNQA